MIAVNGSCCISVKLEPVLGSLPQVKFTVSLGNHHITGPFFGSGTVAEAVNAIAHTLTPRQRRDWLMTMDNLWPVQEENRKAFEKELSYLQQLEDTSETQEERRVP